MLSSSIFIEASSYKSRLERSLAHLALVMVALITVVPMVQPFHALPLPSFYSEWFAIGLGITAGVALLSPNFWHPISIPKVSLYLLGFVALIAAQSSVVHTAYASQLLLPALYLTWAALLATVAFWLRAQLGIDYVTRVLAWFSLCGGLIHVLVGLAQYLDYPGYLADWINYNPTRALSGNIAQSNHYATHLTLAAVALIYLFAIRRLSSSLAAFFLILLIFGLTLSASRVVLIYSVVLLSLSLFLYRATRGDVYWRCTVMSTLLLVLFLLAQYLLPPFSEWLGGILVELGFQPSKLGLQTALERMHESEGIDVRLSEWHKSGLMFLESPVWGVGIGNYGWYSFNYQALPAFASVTTPGLFHHSHNLFAQVAAETGIVGLALLVALLAGWLKQYLLNWHLPANWFIGACLLVLFVHSNTEYPLWYSYFLGIGAFLLGASDSRPVKVKFSPRLGQAAMAATLALCGLILAMTHAGYQTIANVNKLIHLTSPEAAAHALQSTSRYALLAPWAEEVMANHGIIDKRIITRQLALTTRVMLHHPNPIKVQRQITYLALAKQTNQAIELLRVAAAAYPTHIEAYVCVWRDMPDEEMVPIIEYANQVLHGPPSCDSEPASRSLYKFGISPTLGSPSSVN